MNDKEYNERTDQVLIVDENGKEHELETPDIMSINTDTPIESKTKDAIKKALDSRPEQSRQ